MSLELVFMIAAGVAVVVAIGQSAARQWRLERQLRELDDELVAELQRLASRLENVECATGLDGDELLLGRALQAELEREGAELVDAGRELELGALPARWYCCVKSTGLAEFVHFFRPSPDGALMQSLCGFVVETVDINRADRLAAPFCATCQAHELAMYSEGQKPASPPE